ncbi:MAG: family 43 glycosylhydrolase [Clostridia bacterium]|nr:family 43 glycosylhydrolase [Clostridia bacterium]
MKKTICLIWVFIMLCAHICKAEKTVHYIELDEAVTSQFTASMSVLNRTGGNYFNFYVGDGSVAGEGDNYLAVKLSQIVLVSSKCKDEIKMFFPGGAQNIWTDLDIVFDGSSTSVYINGEHIGTLENCYSMEEINASVFRLGFSPWSADVSADAEYRDIKIFDYAMSGEEIAKLRAEETPLIGGEVIAFEGETFGNPLVRDIYTCDPAVLVDGDTVYLYAGHDMSDSGYYYIPEWVCYSSRDLINWKYEGVPLTSADFSWGSSTESWAAQVIKYKDKYYYYICKNGSGISVAVSDSPIGPFRDALDGERLILPWWTDAAHSWDDIDPTVWVENEGEADEQRYIMWGNGVCYLACLNPDMISITDINSDGEITKGEDIVTVEITDVPEGTGGFTEAPWIYKRAKDYYLFFANGWWECLSYATSEDIRGPYSYGNMLMEYGATSNTNHPAVFDFNGKTYMLYHTGALARGSGYRRSVCIAELIFTDSGIESVPESSSGIAAAASMIKNINQSASVQYVPFINNPDVKPKTDIVSGEISCAPAALWQITRGLYDGGDGFVSIQAEDRMGFYITDSDGEIKLTHDENGITETKKQRTFLRIKGLCGQGVSFESVSSPGMYLTLTDGKLTLTNGEDARAASFVVDDAPHYSLRGKLQSAIEKFKQDTQ